MLCFQLKFLLTMDQLVNRLKKAFGICRCMDIPGYLHRNNNDDSVMKVLMTYPVLFFFRL